MQHLFHFRLSHFQAHEIEAFSKVIFFQLEHFDQNGVSSIWK